MRIRGRRIHIAGSASRATDPELLQYAHGLVDRLVQELAQRGTTFVVGVGREEFALSTDPSSLAVHFDWTALAAAHSCLKNGTASAVGPQGRLIATIAP